MSDSQKFIGDKLRLAREEISKSISEMSEKTNIRKSYLVAIEEENFDELPESIYTKNFIKLYARALGIEHDDLIDYYHSHFQHDEIENVNNIPEYKDFGLDAKQEGTGLKIWLPLFLLGLVLAVAVGLWFFNRDFVYKTLPWLNSETNTTTIATDTNPNNNLGNTDLPITETTGNEVTELAATAVTSAAEIVDPLSTEGTTAIATEENSLIATEIPETIKLSIVTDPPGATVNIDNFVMAEKTPILDAPVSSGEKRLVLLSLDGFISHEEEIDLIKDTVLEIGLEPIQIIETTDENGNLVAPTESLSENTITIKTTEKTWLEVWQGSQRNKGEKLVYKVIGAGREFKFDLPVYVHTGNAGGVHIFLGNKDVGKMGSMGEVLGKAFAVGSSE